MPELSDASSSWLRTTAAEPIRAGERERGSVDRVFMLRDGRRIGYREFGDPRGMPVVALHGTPGSRVKYEGSHAAAQAHGLRLISPDRWGYGLSTAKPAARLCDYGADIEALLDGLGIGRVAVTGISGGGPFALATASYLKTRVSAIALVAPVGLICGHGPVRLSAFHTLCFRILPRIPGAMAGVFHLYRAALSLAPNQAMAIAVSRSAAVDREAVRDPLTRSRLIATFATGLQPGVGGPVTDMALFGRPWDFDLSAVTAPVRIWMGLQDRNVPPWAVRALARALPGSDLVEVPGAGHLWVAQNSHQVIGWIAGQSIKK